MQPTSFTLRHSDLPSATGETTIDIKVDRQVAQFTQVRRQTHSHRRPSRTRPEYPLPHRTMSEPQKAHGKYL